MLVSAVNGERPTINITAILPAIGVPTLVIHRTNDIAVALKEAAH